MEKAADCLWSAAFAFLSLPLLLCARLAALDHEAVLIVSAVGVNESGLIVGVEEILLAQSLDLVVDGIQPLLTAGAIVSWLPRDGMPTV